MSASLWRYAALAAALCCALITQWYADALDDLAEARALAEANARAAEAATASAAIADDSAVQHIRAATKAATAKETITRATSEARRDQTYSAWADTPAHPDTWRLLHDAAPVGGSTDTPAALAPGAVPGNADTDKRYQW